MKTPTKIADKAAAAWVEEHITTRNEDARWAPIKGMVPVRIAPCETFDNDPMPVGTAWAGIDEDGIFRMMVQVGPRWMPMVLQGHIDGGVRPVTLLWQPAALRSALRDSWGYDRTFEAL